MGKFVSNTGIYIERPKTDIIFAVIVWLVDLICLHIMGTYNDNAWLYWVLGLVPTVIIILLSIFHDHSIKNLGFYTTHLKQDFLLMAGLLIIEFQIGVFGYNMTLDFAIRSMLYYTFWIGLQEEILYRGFLQGYLFSITKNRKIAYCVGAMMFSLSHVPYQVQIAAFDALFVLRIAITFVTHIVFCVIVDKRGNICIPLAIHVALNFLAV